MTLAATPALASTPAHDPSNAATKPVAHASVAAPSSVAFTFSPNTDPVLSHERITFSVTNPTPGVTYRWDFGETDATPGSATSPFVVHATGPTVTHAYLDPPITDTADNSHFGCPGREAKCPTPLHQNAVYVVRMQAVVAGDSSPILAPAQDIVVVPVQPPVASFDVVRSVGPNTQADAPVQTVTQPIAIVPQAELPGVDTAAQDQIVREDFWFEPAPVATGSLPSYYAYEYWLDHPDVTCVADGSCGRYDEPTDALGGLLGPLVPSDAQLTPVPGETTIYPGALGGNGTWAVSSADVSTGGFSSFSMNFWDQQLAEMGSEGGITEQPQSDETLGELGPATLGYSPLPEVDLADIDGYEGEQGVIGDCFPGYPLGGEANTYGPCLSVLGKNGFYSQTGPYDSNPYAGGQDPAYEGEDEWNFLYNYATVVGVDTPLNSPLGPATGATAGPDGTTVPRTITMIAYDSEGTASAPVSESVPLIPATGPTVDACLEASSSCVTSGVPTTPFSVNAPITVNVAGSDGGTGDIEYYAVQIGQPNSTNNCPPGGSAVASPTVAPPFPVPPFGDLEEGVFPYHNCAAFAVRTINSKEPTPAPPTSGPNTVASAAEAASQTTIRHAGANLGGGLGTTVATEPNSPTSGSPVIIVPASTVASNPSALKIKFTQAGQYSVAVAAYDYSGLGAITRIDGVVVEPAEQSGLCENVSNQPVFIDGNSLGLSGNCVTTILGSGNTPLLYASKSTMDLDGVPLTPQSGYTLVVNKTTNQVYVTNNCTITTGELSMSSLGSLCQNPGSGGRLYLGLGSGGSGTSGFAYWPNGFNAAQDGALDPTVSALPTLDQPGAATAAVTGCGTSGGEAWTLASSATYDDLGVSGNPCVTLTYNHLSRIAFNEDLPQGFGNGSPVTAPIILQGADVPPVGQLVTTPYANVARSHKLWHVLDGSPIPARAADVDFPPVPGCGTNASSALEIPANTEMSNLVDLGAGLQMCYNSKTGVFTGDAMVNIPQPLPITGVDVGFEIGHGRLLQAAAVVSSNIWVGPIDVTGMKFDIQTQPVVVAGALSAMIGPISAQAGLIVHTSPFMLDLDGTVGIASIQFGNFNLDFTSNNASMYAMIGKDFGPVSLNVAVSGGAEWGGPNHFQFYVDGNGSACLFICLGVQGLVSSDGLAACGSINLLVVKFSGGFAVLWKGPNAGLHLFTGCDLEPYIPAGLQNLGGASATRLERSGAPPGHGARGRRRTLTTQPVLSAGQSTQLRLRQPHGCLPSSTPNVPVPRRCIPSVIAVQVHSLASAAGAGVTPLVTLTGPATDPRVIETPTIPGSYDFDTAPLSGATGTTGADQQTQEGSALVDQSPVPVTDEVKGSTADCPTSKNTTATTIPASCPPVTTTTFYVADPGPGLWTLSVDGGSAPVVDVSTADSEPPVTRREFDAAVRGASVKSNGRGFIARIGGHSFSSSLLGQRDRLVLAPSVEVNPYRDNGLAHPDAEDFDVPAIDASRIRAIVLKAPKGYKGTMAILDQGPTSNQVLASGLVPSQIPASGLPILFEPGTDAGTHHIKVFLSNSEGMPSSVMTLSSYTAPPVRLPGKIHILRITRTGSAVHIVFNPGEAPIRDGFELSLSGGNGQRLHDLFTAGEIHPIGALTGVGAARQAHEYMVTLHGIDPTESIRVGIAGSNFGHFSPMTSESKGPSVHALGDSAFIVKLRKHHGHK